MPRRRNLAQIQRFALEWSSEGTAAFTNNPKGDFVLYADHNARVEFLLAELLRLRALVNQARDLEFS